MRFELSKDSRHSNGANQQPREQEDIQNECTMMIPCFTQTQASFSSQKMLPKGSLFPFLFAATYTGREISRTDQNGSYLFHNSSRLWTCHDVKTGTIAKKELEEVCVVCGRIVHPIEKTCLVLMLNVWELAL